MYDSKIIVVGWPRSGTTWLAKLIIHYLDGPEIVSPWTHLEKEQHPQCYRVHEMTGQEIAAHLDSNGKIVFIVRDPRDVAVSEYFFMHEKAHSVVNTTLQQYLQTVFTTERGGWKRYTEEWMRRAIHDDNTHVIFQERLWTAREGELTTLLHALGIEVDADRVWYAVNISWWLGGTRPLYIRTENWRREQPTVPSGRPGEWRNHFGPMETQWMREYCGEFAHSIGYKDV